MVNPADAWYAAIGMLETPQEKRELSRPDELALENPATLAAHLTKTYKRLPHTDLIAACFREIENGDYNRLLVTCPPQVGKTFTAVIWAVFWWLCLNPKMRIIIVCYNTTLALKRSKAIRRLVREHGARYGLYLDPTSHAAHAWDLGTGGGVMAAGIDAGITGNEADAVIVDDPHKGRQEAESPVIRGRVHDAYGPDVLSRLRPGRPLILVQTRWHEDDLAGRRTRVDGVDTKGGAWHVLRMPAFCDDPANDPLGRAFGEPLPHPALAVSDKEGQREHWNMVRAANSPYDFSALYMADPKPVEGALVSWKMLEERRCYEYGTTRPCAQPVRIGVAIDPSGGGRDTAGVVAGYLGDDGRMYLTHDRSKAMPSSQWSREACELAAEIDANIFVIETNYGGDMATLALRTAWDALRKENPGRYSVFCPQVMTVTAKKNKWLRAEPIAQQWVEDRIRTAQYLPDVEAEWATWQPGPESPGRIDASVYLAYELLPVPESGTSQVLETPDVDFLSRLEPGKWS